MVRHNCWANLHHVGGTDDYMLVPFQTSPARQRDGASSKNSNRDVGINSAFGGASVVTLLDQGLIVWNVNFGRSTPKANASTLKWICCNPLVGFL
jgi:hypothetical protein